MDGIWLGDTEGAVYIRHEIAFWIGKEYWVELLDWAYERRILERLDEIRRKTTYIR